MTKIIRYDNKDWTLKEFAEHVEITKSCLNSRLECGWTYDEIIKGQRECSSANSVNSSIAKNRLRIRREKNKAQTIGTCAKNEFK